MRLLQKTLVFAAVTLIAGKALATSDVYSPLPVPRAQDVVAFANGVEDGGMARKVASRMLILRFLSAGRNNTDVQGWWKLEHPNLSRETVCDGVFTDKAGQVYFWTLHTPTVLEIISQDHRQALVQLGK